VRALASLALAALVLGASPPVLATACPDRVAVLDTGIEATHAVFDPSQVVAWRDFRHGLAEPYDDHGHGTATASLAAGSLGARPGAPLVIGKVLDHNAGGTWAAVVDGIAWAVQEGAGVVSLSLAALVPSATQPNPIEPAIAAAREQGVLVVVAAGNVGAEPTEVVAPGSSVSALVVGATASDGTPAWFSNLDPEVVAWGVEVPAAARGGGMAPQTGTSFAVPQVAGWALEAALRACAAGLQGGARTDAVERALEATASDQAWPYAKEGHGLVTAASAQEAAERVLDPALAPDPHNQAANDLSDQLRALWTSSWVKPAS
jgi:hypothetical protein